MADPAKSNKPDSAPIMAEIGSTTPKEREEQSSAANTERPCPECKSPLACALRGEVEPGYCLHEKQAEHAIRWDCDVDDDVIDAANEDEARAKFIQSLVEDPSLIYVRAHPEEKVRYADG